MILKMVKPIFDLYQLFVNDIAGDFTLFMVFALVVLLYITSLMRAPNEITLAIIVIFCIIMAAFSTAVLALVLFVVGVLFAWSLSRLQSRG